MEVVRGIFETPISREREVTLLVQEGVPTAGESGHQVRWPKPLLMTRMCLSCALILICTRHAWKRVESSISFRRTLHGASLSQESISVVFGARFQEFWGFLRLFVA